MLSFLCRNWHILRERLATCLLLGVRFSPQPHSHFFSFFFFEKPHLFSWFVRNEALESEWTIHGSQSGKFNFIKKNYKKSLKEYLCSYLQADIWREIMVTCLFLRYGPFLLFLFFIFCVRNEVLEWTTYGS